MDEAERLSPFQASVFISVAYRASFNLSRALPRVSKALWRPMRRF